MARSRETPGPEALRREASGGEGPSIPGLERLAFAPVPALSHWIDAHICTQLMGAEVMRVTEALI